MEAAWIVPSAVLTVGAAAAAVLLRRIAVAAQELDRAGRRLRRVEDALIPVRVETGRTREALGRYPRR